MTGAHALNGPAVADRPTVTVSIVNWNTREHLRSCLTALEEQAGDPELEIIVVDNASSDGSAEMVAEEFPKVRLFALDENLGFAGGNNIAIAGARGEYILIMNPDVYVREGSIRGCVDFLDRHPAAGGAGALLVGLDGRVQAEFFRRFPGRMQILLFYTLLVYLAQHLRFLRRRYFEHDLTGDGPVAVDQIPGAFFMVRRSVVSDIGAFDPGYFIWFEDVDWCLRMRRAGFPLYALTDLRVTHAGGVSFAGWSLDRSISQFFRSLFRFLAKHDQVRLLRWSRRVLRVDLALKEWLVRFVDALPIAPRKPRPKPGTLRTLRDELDAIVERYRAGELAYFTDERAAGAAADASAGESSATPSASEARHGRAGRHAKHRVDVVVVNWNGRRYLPRCLEALARSEAPARIMVVDNASTDDSVAYLQARHPKAEVIPLDSNHGYAGAANVGVRRGTSDYVFVMNPDVALAPDYLTELMKRAEQEPRLGAAQGKLYRVTDEEFLAGRAPRDELDSAGHHISRTRMVYDLGQGQPDGPAFEEDASVFSASGAALFLRREMLEAIAFEGDYFDPRFFAYKEDIDLCWRARTLGWDVRFVPTARAWHVRSWAGADRPPKERVPLEARRHSWMNHWLMILKNDRWRDVFRHAPWILGWEFGRLGYAILRDPGLLSAYAGVWRHVPAALAFRRGMAPARATGPAITPWFGQDPAPIPAGPRAGGDPPSGACL